MTDKRIPEQSLFWSPNGKRIKIKRNNISIIREGMGLSNIQEIKHLAMQCSDSRAMVAAYDTVETSHEFFFFSKWAVDDNEGDCLLSIY
jgi:hypothetical protein